MSELTLKERVERLERILGSRLNVDFEQIEADEQATKDAFIEAHPDHAEETAVEEEAAA